MLRAGVRVSTQPRHFVGIPKTDKMTNCQPGLPAAATAQEDATERSGVSDGEWSIFGFFWGEPKETRNRSAETPHKKERIFYHEIRF